MPVSCSFDSFRAYAERRCRQTVRKLSFRPGSAMLRSPETSAAIVLFQSQWDYERGEQIERCDICSGSSYLHEPDRPAFLSQPFVMHGQDWIGVDFSQGPDEETLHFLLEQAIARADGKRGRIVVTLPEQEEGDEQPSLFGETPIAYQQDIPAPMRKMYQLYDRGDGSARQRWKNFYLMGLCMRSYEDSVPWGEVKDRPLPTYWSLSPNELRGYFSWRTFVRKGTYQKAPVCFHRLYLFELLNGMETTGPQETLETMKRFYQRYYKDTKQTETVAGSQFRSYLFDYAVIHNLPAEEFQDPAQKQWDRHLTSLLAGGTDKEVCDALNALVKDAVSGSALKDKEGILHLFAEAWRKADGRLSLFSQCFKQRKMPWYPLESALVDEKAKYPDMKVAVNPVRYYWYSRNAWHQSAFWQLHADTTRIAALLRETERLFRAYLHAGRKLKPREQGVEFVPVIQQVIDEDRKARIEASKPHISIDFSHLDQIRQDSYQTRDSLLTDSDLDEEDEAAGAEAAVERPEGTMGLDGDHMAVLSMLLAGGDPASLIQSRRLKPSMVADAINDAFMDAIGDTIIQCDDDTLTLVEDYRGDVERILKDGQA